MAWFVHLTPEKNIGAIRRAGIRISNYGREQIPGVFAMPMLPDFLITHQWLRELKRGGQRHIYGVYFRIPDAEPVLVGHYGRASLRLTAAEAAATIAAANDPMGYEVLLPRKVLPREIRSVRRLPQKLGWRYCPDAHGKPPCGCKVCQPPGSIKSRRIRDQLKKNSSATWPQ